MSSLVLGVWGANTVFLALVTKLSHGVTLNRQMSVL